MVLDDILGANRAWSSGDTAKRLADDRVGVAVVTCYDPRLDGFLRDALGLAPGQAIVLRTAGAQVPRAGDPLRSLALACYRYGLKDVLVVGHSTCRMASFQTAEFVERFRSRGIARSAFGDEDLRAWVGATTDPRNGVLTSVAAIAAAPFIPRDIVVTGAVLDEATGRLDIVHQGPVTAPTPVAAEPPKPVEAPPEPAPAPAPLEPVSPTAGAVESALRLIGKIQSKAKLRDEAMRLRTEMAGARHPIEKLRLLEAFLRRTGGDAREIRSAVDDLRSRAAEAPPAEIADEVIRRLAETARE